MDPVLLSRIQFAVTIAFHFLFVPLTLGLVILVAIMETLYRRTGKELYYKMAEFWGKIFLINFLLGVVTGITMEFQIGTNWSVYSHFMGDIFGAPLAIEAMVAFFLESTFIGIWVFGRHKFPKLRTLSMWMVALGTTLSSLWIITANGFMQHPVGYELLPDKVILKDFWALVFNPYAWRILIHTLGASYVVGGFFVMGVSAYHLLRRPKDEVFNTSFRFGLILALIAATLQPVTGHISATAAVVDQPAKAAAMDSIWQSGPDQPYYLFVVPKMDNTGNLIEWGRIPYLGSLLYTDSLRGYVPGLDSIAPEDRPPVWMVTWSFRIMVWLGFLFLGATWYAFYLVRKKKLLDKPWLLKFFLYAIPLPYVATLLGWVVTEVGRQPWIVYGLMRTADAVSPLPPGQILFTLIGLVVFYGTLIVADIILIARTARKGYEGMEDTPATVEKVPAALLMGHR